ncbi:putative RNA-binding protein Luc7-like 1 isoform X2 [Watersipora subatra]
MDLGECPKIHDHALRADFEAASKDRDYFYDIDAMEHLEEFIVDCDRRTEIAKKKLKETQDDLTEEATVKADAILQLGEEIGTKLAKAEACGAEGNIEDSIKLMAEVEELNKNKAEAEEDFKNSMPASTYQQQKLRVCEVCGAYLGIHDNDRRLADHFGGKLHIGFIEIRDKLDDLKKTMVDRRAARDMDREDRVERRRAEREKDRSRSRSRKRSRDRDRGRRGGSRERRRSRSRDRKRRSSRERKRDRRRSRSRSRDRRNRRRSRSRDRRSRDRSRDRNGDHGDRP